MQWRVAELEEAQYQEKEVQQQWNDNLQESQVKQCVEVARLEWALQEAQAQLKELGLKVSLAEARAQGLEEQLGQNEAIRRNLEHRLNVLSSTLRRTLGSGRGRQSPAPWRTRSGERTESLTMENSITCER